MLVIEGGLTETVGDASFDRRAAESIYTPPGRNHSDLFHREGARTFLIEISPEWLLANTDGHSVFDRPAAGATAASRVALNIWREFRTGPPQPAIVVESMCVDLLAAIEGDVLWCTAASAPPWLRMARDMFHANLSDTVSLMDAASVAGVHPVHLARAFRSHYRCTTGEYVRRLRVEYASKLLAEGTLSLSHVALEAGFTDQSHLTHVFKRLTGWTPREYRGLFRLADPDG